MRQLETKPMTSFNETQIDKPEAFSIKLANGAELGYEDVVAATPAVTSTYDGYARPQLVLGNEKGIPAWDESRFYPVGRLATFHGRNLEVLADSVSIEDSFGNTYQSLCIKGSDFSDPHLFKSATASRDYIVYGLQESLVMERVLRASKLLRENGIGTEYICGLSLPESFPIDKQGGAIDDKAPAQFGDFLETLSARYAAENQNGKSALEIKTKMIERFSDCDYLVTYRAFDCPYRFGELRNTKQFVKFKEFRKLTCDDPVEIERIENQKLPDYIDSEFVPKLASNLAKLHKLGLVHGFLHSDNITALGSIVDLDSVQGEALGLGDTFEDTSRFKRDIKQAAQIEDVFECIRGIKEVAMNATNVTRADASPEGLAEKFLADYLTDTFETNEQQDAFILKLLGHIYSISYLSDDASDMYRNSQLIFGAYVRLNPDILDIDQVEIPLPNDKVDTHFRRKNSMYFSLFPTALIKDMRKQILKDPTPVSESELKGKDYQDAAINGMKQLVKNQLSIHHVIELLSAERHKDKPLSMQQIMVSLGCMLGELQPDCEDETLNKRLTEIQDYFYEQNKQFLSRLVRYHPPERYSKGAHHALTLETQRELHDCTAEAWLHTAGRSPVYYMKEEAQYGKIFEELAIDKDTEVEYVNLKGVMATPDYEGNSTIILADYNKAHLIACHFWKDYALKELLIPEMLSADSRGIKPTIMIRDVFGKPKVQIISYPKLDDGELFKETADYQDLLEEVTPNIVQPRQLVLP